MSLWIYLLSSIYLQGTLMKKFISYIALFISSSSFAAQLHNYEQIVNAVSNGKFIRLVMNYQKCIIAKGVRTIPNNYAVYTPNAMAIDTEGSIGTYLLYFTMNDPSFPSKPVYQYVKFIISKDDNLQMILKDLNPNDYSPLGFEQTLNCKIDDGVTVYSGNQFVNSQQAMNMVNK